ncbi:hypothetical protein ACFL0H_11115 [Thermodesulfobacteriota bacterium]
MKVVFRRIGGVSSEVVVSATPLRLIQKRKDTHTMPKDNVIELKKPEPPFVDDPITEVLRTGAKKRPGYCGALLIVPNNDSTKGLSLGVRVRANI